MSKKKNTDSIHFLGESSNDVTGSQYLITFGDKKILLECGLYQSSSNDYLDSYKVNSKKFDFKPNEIDYVFVCHPHIDHVGLLPRLVNQGFDGSIICTYKTSEIMRSLLLNCSFIVEDEARVLSKRYGRTYDPLYSKDDVFKTLAHVRVFDDFNTIFKLDNTVSFQWFKNSHCLGAAQVQIILSSDIKTKKVLYTSDLGAINTNNHYVEDTEIPTAFSDVTIMESTYGSNKNKSNRKTRMFDMEHLRVAINTTINRGGSVIMPCFSFSRTQEILTNIYMLYHDDPNFNCDIYVDSKLSVEICSLYSYLLDGEDQELWQDIVNWNKVHFVYEKTDSKLCQEDNRPKIVLSSSGFCVAGRIINYLKKYLPDSKSMIIFSGYVGDNSSYLSYRIKNYKDYKRLTINKVPVTNKADCITMSSFSSHADKDDLVTFGSSLNTNRIVLVHGSDESKKMLQDELKKEISKNDKTYRVSCSTKGMKVPL